MPRASSDQISSSTMMNGATSCLASNARSAAEVTTIAVSHAQVGTRARALPKLGLSEAAGDLLRLGRLRRDADVRCRVAHVAEHRVVHCRASRGRLERSAVELGHVLDGVLVLRETGG